MFTNQILKTIFEKTHGHCHFCGDKLVFEKYGVKNIEDIGGVWEADHIIQRGKGGDKQHENCLPACLRCNRLRWHRIGEDLRDLLILGLIAKEQIKKKSILGNKIIELKNKRLEQNIRRRRALEK